MGYCGKQVIVKQSDVAVVFTVSRNKKEFSVCWNVCVEIKFGIAPFS